ncbi:MAG TPA: MSMEG_0567/Sll0786 family nitrogen starvation N-acetyltransferase [Solirubrobacteraceae bacterium]
MAATTGSPPSARERRARRPVALRLTRDARERAAHLAVRRAVFVVEQGLFEGDDVDALDAEPGTLHALGLVDDVPAGAVRLYEHGAPGDWRGDRLAVLPDARHTTLGASLVRFAVRTAGERGGSRMDAMIQLPNVGFFEALGWRRDGAVQRFHGVDHQPMAIALSADPGP